MRNIVVQEKFISLSRPAETEGAEEVGNIWFLVFFFLGFDSGVSLRKNATFVSLFFVIIDRCCGLRLRNTSIDLSWVRW
jgi:hypothetical protein